MAEIKPSLLQTLREKLLTGVAANTKPLCIALSGGRDSVALANAFSFIVPPEHLRALIIDHGLQQGSDRWAQHSADWAQSIGIQPIISRVDPQLIAHLASTLGVEGAARQARYSALREMAIKQGASCVALGHHRDDQVETVLMQIARGSGLRGAAGMSPWLVDQHQANFWWWRPMLELPRSVIDEYVVQANLDYVEDPSNSQTHFRRNAIRLEVMPKLREVFVQADESIARFAVRVQQVDEALQEYVAEDLATCLEKRSCSGGVTDEVLSLGQLEKLSEVRKTLVIQAFVRSHGLRNPEERSLQEALRQLFKAKSDSQPLVQMGDGALGRYRGNIYWIKPEELNATVLPRWQWRRADVGEAGLNKELIERSTLTMSFRSKLSIEGLKLKFAKNRPRRSLKHHFQELGIPPWRRDRAQVLVLIDPRTEGRSPTVLWVEYLGVVCPDQREQGWVSPEEGLLPVVLQGLANP